MRKWENGPNLKIKLSILLMQATEQTFIFACPQGAGCIQQGQRHHCTLCERLLFNSAKEGLRLELAERP